MTATTPIKPAQVTQVRPAGPCAIVIFGAAGDLTKRLLMPALYNLAHAKLLPKEFAIIGFAHTALNTDDFRSQLHEGLQKFAPVEIEPDIWQWFEERISYFQGDFKDANAYTQLKNTLEQTDQDFGTQGNYLFYLATSADFFCDITQQLGAAGLTKEESDHWRHVVIEKPFGHDLASAKALNRAISRVLDEHQIYRIDHYLGKETVQNIMVFRFGNNLFEPMWNRHYIDHVQITVAETVGVETRGGFYEGTGALRDMVPNHLFQLLSLIAMEPPTSFEANAVRDEKSKLLTSIEPLTPEEVLTHAVRGQYGAGTIDGKPVSAYRSESRVAPDSSTETYAALKLTIDNWRWADVPFYLRTGKRLPRRVSEIAIQFKRVPSLLFRDVSIDNFTPNLLIVRIQPDEGIHLQFGAKIPGPTVQMGAVNMDFCYASYFGKTPNIGYETLLYDCMIGDATLFNRSDNVELGWSVVDPILDVWKALPPRDFPNYAAGSWGPKEADELLARDGNRWRDDIEYSCPI